MMRGDCLVRTPARPWSPALQLGDKEAHDDSGISPGRSSSDGPSNSPHSPSRPRGSPDSGPYPRSPADSTGPYIHSPNTASSPPEQSEGSLDRLKMALERSTALSSIYKNESDSKESEGQPDTPRKEFQCPLCAYTSPYRHRYMEHVSTHYSDKCTLCEYKGQNFLDLRSHLADVHGVVGGDFTDFADPTDQPEQPSDGLEDDENGRRSKSKNFRCKHCPYVTATKVDFWEHTKTHIKAEKLLTCPKCPFVTEYKHHLEYHLRNHFGSKPFKCTKCSYSCVNKSMLNSHLKSHSNVYQYRCADCAYATKYCHSLKLHLRKYEHSPAMVLNQDGSPNPLPIIDVYGTRRGPKQKGKLSDEVEKQNLPGGITVPVAPYSEENTPKLLVCQLCEFYTPSPEIFHQHMYLHNPESPFAQMIRTNNNLPDPSAMKDYFKNIFLSMEQPPSPLSMISPHHSPLAFQPSSPLDLTKSEFEMKEEKRTTDNKKNRRKGKAYKLERAPETFNEDNYSDYKRTTNGYPVDLVKNESSRMDDDLPNNHLMEPIVNIHEDSYEVNMNSRESSPNKNCSSAEVEDEPIDVVGDSYKIKIPTWKPNNEVPIKNEKSINESSESKTETSEGYSCNFCDMSFKDLIMYTMHMGYHGYRDPFTCNMCGQETPNRVAFFLHIARVSHT